MREILFKAKRIDNDEWIESMTIANGTIKRKRDWLFMQIGDDVWKQVNPKTVCQFTGLLDKDGNKIFEGDKITYCDFRGDYTRKSSIHDGVIDGWLGIIEWSNNNGWGLNKINDHNKEMLKAKDSEKFDRQAPYVFYNSNINRVNPKIIGNIHD
jgi:uncharacterized phage protein (TIGR01671 family)